MLDHTLMASLAGKNIRILRQQKGLTQQAFADRLGIKRSLLGAYEEQRAEPRLDVLQKISEWFGVALEDLLWQDLSAPGVRFRRLKEQAQQMPRQRIEFVPQKAAAGYLQGYSDEEFIEELNTFTLPMLGAGHYRAFEISGDSMLPVESGSVVVGHRVERLEDVKNQQPCIVVTRQEGIVYKRIQKSNRQPQKITLVSDNPAYPPYSVAKEDILEIWQADLIISRPAQKPRIGVEQLAEVVQQLQSRIDKLQRSSSVSRRG
ncbi:helix-turn-helix protein [Thermoflavifilum aggregans]|uniref:Helix-turn-helix protein n=2 Tax=Thermoflavifilum aggregans TaxID=454188 RepID=A0A2M9CXN4_9BACT|nr:helix-turn-helix protein [Thermoflavifilum aggregans]